MTTYEAAAGVFDFGRVVQRTFRVIGQDFAIFMLGAVALVSAPAFIGTILGWQAQLAGNYFSLPSMLGTLATIVGGLVLQGLIVYTVIARLNGRSVSIGDAIAVGARFLLPLLGLGVLQALGVFLGMIFFIVPGLILAVIWSVAAPSLVAEKRGVLDSLQRSRDLTRGHRWTIFGLFVIYFILSMIIGAVAGALGFATGFSSFRAAASGSIASLTPMIVISTLISSLISGLQGVIAAAGASSLYYELRSTKEGVGPEQLASVFD